MITNDAFLLSIYSDCIKDLNAFRKSKNIYGKLLKKNFFLQLNSQQKMGLKDFMEKTVLRMDLLSCSPSLRVRGEPNYQTFCGGIFSFLIMGGFAYVLYLQFVSMFNNLQITYSQGLSDDISSDSSITSLQMAVQIQGVDFSSNTKKFRYFLNHVGIENVNGNVTQTFSPVTLTPCQLSDWTNVGTNFKQQFNAFGFDKMLCIQSGQSYQLSGYIGSDSYHYMTFQIVQCNATIDPTCDSTSNINTFMTNYLSNNDYFKVRFFLVDTIITPDSDDPITYVIEKNIFMAFTDTVGTVGYINMAEYTIQTDNNPLPITTYQETTGSYIQSFQTNSVSISTTKYVSVNIYKSTKAMTITRTIGKFDVVLSYVGGLFGLIFTGIAFFVSSYSEMKYQMYVAEATLSLDESGKKIGESDFGFMTYLAYCVYDWLETFGLAPHCIKFLKNIHEVRQEACEQLNPVLILKRIKYLEDVSKVLLNEHRQLALYLAEPMTVQQARRMRQTLEYYDKALLEIENENEKDQNIIRDQKQSSSVNAAANNEQVQDSVKEEQPAKELTEEEEEEMLQNLMIQAVCELEKDNSELGKKIQDRINKKARRWLKEAKKQRELVAVEYDSIGPMSPNFDSNNDSAVHFKRPENKKKFRLQIK